MKKWSLIVMSSTVRKSFSKLVVYLENNVTELFEVLKKCIKWNSKNYKEENGRIMILSKCAVCDSKKLKFIKQQETSKLLSGLLV